MVVVDEWVVLIGLEGVRVQIGTVLTKLTVIATFALPALLAWPSLAEYLNEVVPKVYSTRFALMMNA